MARGGLSEPAGLLLTICFNVLNGGYPMSEKNLYVFKHMKRISLSLLLCAALVSPVIAQNYTTKVVPENVPSLTLYQSTWLVKENTRLSELTICERAVLKAPEGKYLTLTVNGIGKDIKPGLYKGDVVLSVTDNYLMTPHALMRGNQISRNFHTAILIDDGRVVPEKSTPAVVYGGEVTDTKTEGIYIASEEESFNGIVIAGDTEYTINNVKMDLDGFGDNDFIGVGAGVTAIDNARVTINDSEFNMSGVTRCAVHVGGDSVVTLNNCKLFNHSPDTDWLGGFSWQVGFTGSNRLAQLTDNATVYYNNCRLKTNGWGILSIDGSDKHVKMYVKDSTLELSGPRAHGYGAFCIGANEVTFDHCTVDVNGYPMMVMGMGGENRPSIINGCLIKGRRFGAFVCSDKNSVFTIKDSTFQTDKSTLVIKGSATTINIDNTVMNAKNGVIVQLMDTDESGMNVTEYRVPVGIVDVALPNRDLTNISPTEDVNINIANSNIRGNFFNSTTNIRAYKNSATGGMGSFHDTVVGVSQGPSQSAAPTGAAPAGEGPGEPGGANDLRGPKNLGLNFTNVRIEGVISSATQAYREGLTVIREDNRHELSNITQKAAETVNNGVIVSLDKDSVWIVTGASYITSLTIDEGAEVKAPEGKGLTMLVNGKKTKIAPGRYTGKIQMVVN